MKEIRKAAPSKGVCAMKKLIASVFVLLLILSSCGKNGPTVTTDALITDKDPSDMIDSIYEKLNSGSETAKYIPQLLTEDITEKNEEYYLGIAGIPYSKGAASEAYIQPVTYSFSIILLKENSDYDAQRKIIEQHLNKSKWVCATAPDALVVRYGNAIAVIMGPTAVCNELEQAFLDLCSSK